MYISSFCLSSPLLVESNLGYFCLLSVGNNAAVNLDVIISLQVLLLILLGDVPRSGITKSYGCHLILILKFC